MDLTLEMVECIRIRLQEIGKCSACPGHEIVERRCNDNHCMVSVKVDEWLWSIQNRCLNG